MVNWLNVSPTSGSGDGSVSVSSKAEHTGRNSRTTTLTWSASGCTPVTRNVIQAGKPEFISASQQTITIPNSGGEVALSGLSNASRIVASVTTPLKSNKIWENLLDIGALNHYTAAGISVDNMTINGAGQDIPGDPGATAQFTYTFGSLTVPENTTVNAKTEQITITTTNGSKVVVTINQSAGAPYLNVAEGDINLTYQGTAVSKSVESNTSWTVA